MDTPQVPILPLAAAYFPELLCLVIEPQQPISRIMPLSAIRAGNEAAQVHPFTVVPIGNRKAHPTAAGDQKHTKIFRLGRSKRLFAACFIGAESSTSDANWNCRQPKPSDASSGGSTVRFSFATAGTLGSLRRTHRLR